MSDIMEWLLAGEPWIEYNTRIHLLDQSEDEPEVSTARTKMLNQPELLSIMPRFQGWQEEIVSNHKKANLLLHKLSFLADIGFKAEDKPISELLPTIVENRTEEGVIKVPINVPVVFGGTGENSWGWCLCDTPTVLYSLIKFGLCQDQANKNAVEYLSSLISDTGWGCKVSPELGKFRGPGKKGDPCPYATLLMLKVLAQLPEYRDSRECHIGAEALLRAWENSREQHPYMFYMGTDFRKMKLPMVWYDIIHVADVLSRFDWLKDDSRLLEMVAHIKSQATENGTYIPQSEWKAWNGWEFSQKKDPSRWLTLLVLQIEKRMSYK